MSDMELYARYFPVGKKVGVGIPLPNADVFKDWAIIHEINEDLVSLQLSRDVLPAEVSLHYGQILELRGGSEENAYCCRAIVVSEGVARELLLRLIGEVVSDELREFYRIDAFLPIKYFITADQNIDRLHKQWNERRILRQQLVIEQAEKPWSVRGVPLDPELPEEHYNEFVEIHGEPVIENASEDDLHGSWDSTIPLAANISGGGLRTVTHHGFEDGEYILLEILLPSPMRVIDVIGRIVFANRNYAAGGDYEYFNTGVQFVYIDERDRDAIVTYISTIQLKRIRQLRERYLYRSSLEDSESEEESVNKGIKITSVQILIIALFLVVLTAIAYFFWQYAHDHPKGEIQRTFEDEIRKYRDQLR
ncbi:MAG: DUF5634 family protein [Desulfuromonadaceae bacterium]|nr:DUF5634 family protein [Desulfuromonadaceae bacterium]MDD2856229.1 DUF5634 family protein [Desulfuromonadaceae bacterium]